MGVKQIPQALGLCRIPDDCIDPKRYPLFMARAVVLSLLGSAYVMQPIFSTF